MLDSLLAATPNVIGPVLAANRDVDPKEQRTTGGAAFYRLYDTRDGRQLALAGQEPKFIERVLTALGRPDLVGLCAHGPGPQQRPVVDALQAFFGSRTRQESLDWLAKLDVGYAPVNTLHEATQDAQVEARELLLRDAGGRLHLAPPIRFSAEPARPDLREPLLGEHTAQILAELDAAAQPR
jgi:crotonobetainyl-CoA:carnitine CoA-transferase CaiB-like acyl-CoA transferase